MPHAVHAAAGDFNVQKLTDMFDAIQWLHQHVKRVHRDLELKNVGEVNGRAALYDFSTSDLLFDAQSPHNQEEGTGYAGTCVGGLYMYM
jgi:hypothetical protein